MAAFLAQYLEDQVHDDKTRYLAKYECTYCNIKWKLRNSSGRPKPCEDCNRIIRPYKKEEIKYLATYSCVCGFRWDLKCTEKESEYTSTCKMCKREVKNPKRKHLRPKRMFGEFFCSSCQHEWKSGNAWEGKGQQCFTCRKMILPHTLRPLMWSGISHGAPHREDLCEMCKELGHNCREYNPKPIEQDDDDQSVRSFSSFTTDNSGGDDDASDITPTASDNEDDLDFMLSKKITHLKLN